MPAPIPAFAPVERPESDASEDVVLLVSLAVALALALDALVVLDPVTSAAALVDADGLTPALMRIA